MWSKAARDPGGIPSLREARRCAFVHTLNIGPVRLAFKRNRGGAEGNEAGRGFSDFNGLGKGRRRRIGVGQPGRADRKEWAVRASAQEMELMAMSLSAVPLERDGDGGHGHRPERVRPVDGNPQHEKVQHHRPHENQ
ncbi:hypothetical protein NITGR_270027 [Nitrospina gracilis 3/211]|uniref:Uncharacterized protein n=1 Tax=Nitrospina gracilis (strain 3/211) TaxID=1266370 RepID=M1YIF8_NITG3|nr:hypothetical protein NITGR_270027 [Nitrospina gracilis 3/211]